MSFAGLLRWFGLWGPERDTEDAPVVEHSSHCARCGASTYGLEFGITYNERGGPAERIPLCGKCTMTVVNDALRRLDSRQRAEWILSLLEKEGAWT